MILTHRDHLLLSFRTKIIIVKIPIFVKTKNVLLEPAFPIFSLKISGFDWSK